MQEKRSKRGPDGQYKKDDRPKAGRSVNDERHHAGRKEYTRRLKKAKQNGAICSFTRVPVCYLQIMSICMCSKRGIQPFKEASFRHPNRQETQDRGGGCSHSRHHPWPGRIARVPVTRVSRGAGSVHPAAEGGWHAVQSMPVRIPTAVADAGTWPQGTRMEERLEERRGRGEEGQGAARGSVDDRALPVH